MEARFQSKDDVKADLQIKGLLGRGAMGEVYLARQLQWDLDVALKIPNDEILVDPENRHRILREAEAWTDLGLHPNIAYCYYAQSLGELLLLVIEYVDGGNLRDWIADGRCADLKTGLDLAIQFCHGLEHTHKKSVVHRDIKPENVLLMKDGTLKVTDFGIVRKAIESREEQGYGGPEEPSAPGMTVAGIGTADYMAPEQWGDQNNIDFRADIFAFGICLYEMLCGARPAVGPSQEPPDPGRMRGKVLPERLSQLMKRCVEWDRERRPVGAREVRAELCAVYEEVFGEPCVYAELPELTSQADDWNNRALSYLVLGRTEDAEKAWQTALEADPRHPESTYNNGLHRWHSGRVTDLEVVTNMRGVAESDPSAWLPRYLLAQLHLERGDAEGASEELAKIPSDSQGRPEVVAARRAIGEMPGRARLVRTFGKYGRALYLSADGRLSLAGAIHDVQLWDVDSGHCLCTFEGHTNSVDSVCLSADGRLALSGSRDKTLKLWDVTSGLCLRTFEGHAEWVCSVCLSADGLFGLSGSKDKTLKLWDVASGRCLRTFEGHTQLVASICFTTDGRQALSGSWDKTLKLWDVGNERCLRTFEGHTAMVSSVRMGADGRFALSGSKDKTLNLWDVASGRCLRTFEGHAEAVNSVCLSADGRHALSGGDDKTVRLWDVESGRCLRTFEGITDEVQSVTMSTNRRLALTSQGDIRLWRLWESGTLQYSAGFRLGRPIASAESLTAATRHAAALLAARTAAGSGDTARVCRCLRLARQGIDHKRAASAVQQWAGLYTKLRRGALEDCWLLWRSNQLYASVMCLSADRQFGLAGCLDKVKTWNVESGGSGRTLGHTPYVQSVCMSADGRYALAGGWGELKLWDMASGRCLRTFESHTGSVESVCLSADGRFGLSGSDDKTVKLWDVASGRCLRTFESHTGSVESACLSADGLFGLSGSKDKTLKLWDVASGRCLRTFEGHTRWVESVSLSADGRYALSGSWDKTLKLWDVGNGRCLRTFEGHTDKVRSVCMGADPR